MPQKAKDAEDCTSGGLKIRKKDSKKNAWNMNTKFMCQKKQ